MESWPLREETIHEAGVLDSMAAIEGLRLWCNSPRTGTYFMSVAGHVVPPARLWPSVKAGSLSVHFSWPANQDIHMCISKLRYIII
jgi:hypothetical protein